MPSYKTPLSSEFFDVLTTKLSQLKISSSASTSTPPSHPPLIPPPQSTPPSSKPKDKGPAILTIAPREDNSSSSPSSHKKTSSNNDDSSDESSNPNDSAELQSLPEIDRKKECHVSSGRAFIVSVGEIEEYRCAEDHLQWLIMELEICTSFEAGYGIGGDAS
ncbi:hypothetical protein Syun_001704 [Stephania yunnanensis]|uniref:Uncharacterized protein n=1 Tax=Stephania yunnanensis TaxID=152371 RepID=A0AAP0LK21_9MAGN